MDNPKVLEVTSYAGSAASIGSALTLTDIGIIIGIVTALATLALNVYYTRKRDQREQRETEAAIAQYESHHEHGK